MRSHAADTHDGPKRNTLQSEAGYIDARPLTAGPYIGSIASFSRWACEVRFTPNTRHSSAGSHGIFVAGDSLSLHWSPKIRIAAPIGPFAPRRLRRNGAARNGWWVADDDGCDDGHHIQL